MWLLHSEQTANSVTVYGGIGLISTIAASSLLLQAGQMNFFEDIQDFKHGSSTCLLNTLILSGFRVGEKPVFQEKTQKAEKKC